MIVAADSSVLAAFAAATAAEMAAVIGSAVVAPAD